MKAGSLVITAICGRGKEGTQPWNGFPVGVCLLYFRCTGLSAQGISYSFPACLSGYKFQSVPPG